MSEAPESIYLQQPLHEDDWEAATWCADQIEEDDIEYVRAARITALEAENKALREGLREIIDLIVTCPDAPRAPDSLPQCILLVAESAFLAKEKTS